MTSPVRAASTARRQLAARARPAGEFDASRYFRAPSGMGFYNVGAKTVRSLARTIADAHRTTWTIDDAMMFADRLMRDRHLEAKGLGIETLARYRRRFEPRLLSAWKGWLEENHAANWATTDAICGVLIGPLLLAHPKLVRRIASWSRHSNMWVRRAAAVGLIVPARRGMALDVAYRVAGRLHSETEDLIQKAVGWLLREAGKADEARLERYLRRNGPRMPRTTVRYAIERFPPGKRRDLLFATKNSKIP